MLGRFQQFSYVITCIHGYIQKLERDEMVCYGYKGAFAQYLAVLYGRPDGLTAAQLCQICDKDKAAVSRIVSEMEARGLIARECGAGRLYNARITLTESGKQAAAYVCGKAMTAVAMVGGDLSDQDREVFYSTLGKIAEKLKGLSETGIPALSPAGLPAAPKKTEEKEHHA